MQGSNPITLLQEVFPAVPLPAPFHHHALFPLNGLRLLRIEIIFKTRIYLLPVSRPHSPD